MYNYCLCIMLYEILPVFLFLHRDEVICKLYYLFTHRALMEVLKNSLKGVCGLQIKFAFGKVGF